MVLASKILPAAVISFFQNSVGRNVNISTLCPFSCFPKFVQKGISCNDISPTDATSILIQQVNSGHQICIEVNDGFSHLTVFDHMDPMGLKLFNVFFWWWFGWFLIFQSGEGEIWGNIGNKIRNNNGSLIVQQDKDRHLKCVQRQGQASWLHTKTKTCRADWLYTETKIMRVAWKYTKTMTGQTFFWLDCNFENRQLSLSLLTRWGWICTEYGVEPKSGVGQKISFSMFPFQSLGSSL